MGTAGVAPPLLWFAAGVIICAAAARAWAARQAGSGVPVPTLVRPDLVCLVLALLVGWQYARNPAELRVSLGRRSGALGLLNPLPRRVSCVERNLSRAVTPSPSAPGPCPG